MSGGYVPERGDLVWLEFQPQAGHEQAGRRPAIVLSPREYNRLTRLMLCCPITSKVKNFPFEVPLPEGLVVEGVILCDQLRNLDWSARNVSFIAQAPKSFVQSVLAMATQLLK